MDEVFWSNVVKRWSDASENVILLKKELAKVQEEVRVRVLTLVAIILTLLQRTLYRKTLEGLRQPESRGNDRKEEHSHWTPDDDIDHDHDYGNLRDELQDAETGLRRAKEEYRRLQHDVCSYSLVAC